MRPLSRAVSRAPAALALALVVVGWSACPTDVQPPGTACTDTQPCAEGLACQDGVCIQPCTGDGDCERGKCDATSGRCVDCLSADDCGPNLVCNDFSHTCVQPVQGCTNDDECGLQRCDTVKGSCVDCLGDDDCGLGAVCDLLSHTCAVQQSCVTDGDCPEADSPHCDPAGRTCVECFNDAHCPSGLCDLLSSSCVAGCSDDDPTEPNDGAGQEVTIQSGGSHEGTLCAGDVDRFSITAEGRLHASLSVDGGATFVLTLLSSGGAVVASSTPSGSGAALDADALAAGTYTLAVQGGAVDEEGDYLLEVDVTAPQTCTDLDTEPNDTTVQAATIPVDGTLRSGTICNGNLDLWKFTVAAGDDVRVDAIAGDGAGTLALSIVDGAGATVASGNPATIDNAAAGTLFARVSATGGDVGYSVKVTASAAPPVCNQTDAEPNDADAQALALNPGTQAAGSICAGDTDQWRFAAAALDDATITVTGSGLTARLIRAADGVQVASGLFMNVADLAAGGYRIVVSGSTPATEKAYTVDVQLTPEPVPDPCTEGGVEPDAQGDARLLSNDGTPQAGRICASDTDFFTFTLPFQSTVTVHTHFVDADGDIDIRLTDSAGALITTSAGVTDDENIVRTLAAGTYGVEVFGFNGAVNTYTIDLTLRGCTPEDGFEDNNAVARATPIGTAAINAARCPGDDDFFAIRLEQGDALAATLNGSGLTMSLLSSSGQLLTNDTAAGANRSLSTSGLPAGRYVVRVTGTSGNRIAYTLTAGITATPSRCIDDGSHPNDSNATAFSLDANGLLDGSYQIGSLVVCSSGDADWFSIALPGGKKVALQASFDPAKDIDVELLEPRGTSTFTRSIARSFATGEQDRVEGIINAGGTFFVRGVGFVSAQTAYGIGIEVSDPPASSCVDDRFDTWTATNDTATPDTFTNNVPTSAVQLSPPETLSTMRICPSNADWYRVTASAGQTLRVHVDYAHASGRDIDVRLYGPASQTTPLATCSQQSNTTGTNLTCISAGVDGSEDLVTSVATAGDHFIEVFGFSSGENVYTLSVTN